MSIIDSMRELKAHESVDNTSTDFLNRLGDELSSKGFIMHHDPINSEEMIVVNNNADQVVLTIQSKLSGRIAVEARMDDGSGRRLGRTIVDFSDEDTIKILGKTINKR